MACVITLGICVGDRSCRSTLPASKVPICLPLLKYTFEDCQLAAISVPVGIGVCWYTMKKAAIAIRMTEAAAMPTTASAFFQVHRRHQLPYRSQFLNRS